MSNRKKNRIPLSKLSKELQEKISNEIINDKEYTQIDIESLRLVGYNKTEGQCFVRLLPAKKNITRYASCNENKFVNKMKLASILGVSRVTLNSWLTKGLIEHIIQPHSWNIMIDYIKSLNNRNREPLFTNCSYDINKLTTNRNLKLTANPVLAAIKCVKKYNEIFPDKLDSEINNLFNVDYSSDSIPSVTNSIIIKDSELYPQMMNKKLEFSYIINYQDCSNCGFLASIINKKIRVLDITQFCDFTANLYYQISNNFNRLEIQSIKIQMEEKCL